MKLIYRCYNCAAQNEFDAPAAVARNYPVEFILAGEVPNVKINMWIRHPCRPGTHGIAPLIAIVDD